MSAEHEDARVVSRNNAPAVPVVARPRRFLGGPLYTTMFADLGAVVGLMTVWFIYDLSALVLFGFLAVHGTFVIVGAKEPHLDSLVSAYTRLPRHRRHGAAGRNRFPGARYVIEP